MITRSASVSPDPAATASSSHLAAPHDQEGVAFQGLSSPRADRSVGTKRRRDTPERFSLRKLPRTSPQPGQTTEDHPAANRLDTALRDVFSVELPGSTVAALAQLRAAAHAPQQLDALVHALPAADASRAMRAITLDLRLQRLQRDVNQPDLSAELYRALSVYATPAELAADLAKLDVQPVFTAHPSEVIPTATLDKLAQVAENLEAFRTATNRADRLDLRDDLHALLAGMLHDDPVRAIRPTVDEEVDHLLRVFSRTLFDGVPAHFSRIEAAARRRFGAAAPVIPAYLRFHSWVGGDRDGNPNVTAVATRVASAKMRRAILQHYRAALRQADDKANTDPVLRGYLHGMRERLFATANLRHDGYPDSAALRDDLDQALRRAESEGLSDIAESLSDMRRVCDVFGLHLATLEWRQDAGQVLEAVREAAPSANGRILDGAGKLSGQSQELIASLRALADARAENGKDAVGELILANTESAEEILQLGRLARECGVFDQGEIPVVPLFETIHSLERAPEVAAELLTREPYRSDVAAMGNKTEVMLGYSDSAKDGGRFASDSYVHSTQDKLATLYAAQEPPIQATFFHGRGGSLGRGVSSPEDAFSTNPASVPGGTLKQTEQGETLALRYGHASVTANSLDRMFLAALASLRAAPPDEAAFAPVRDRMAKNADHAYRAFIHDPRFVPFFAHVTPLTEIASLANTSRPAKRGGGAIKGLEDLRAIPYNFAFNQSWAPVNAWFGTGAALARELAEPDGAATLRAAYAANPSFAASMDRAANAIANTNLDALRANAELLHPDTESREDMLRIIADAFTETAKALEHIRRQPNDRPEDQPEYVDLTVAQALQRRFLAESRQNSGAGTADVHTGIAGIAAGLGVTG